MGVFGIIFVKAAYSIKQNSDFRRIFGKGKCAVTPYAVVYAMKSRGLPGRVGISVSSKLGNAVSRNRMKRRLREVFRLSRNQLKPGYDLIIVARHKCLSADFNILEDAFLSACRELGIVK